MSTDPFRKITLKNGLRLLTIPMKGIKSVTVLVAVSAGSRYETIKNNGISHFLEHMLFKGTKKRPSALDVASTIDSIGGEFNGSVGKESASFYVKSGARHLPLALDFLSDILANSLFDPKEIEKERGVITEEINLREDTPIAKAGEVFDALLYGKTPLGWRIIGRRENIKKMQRKDFLVYLKRFYQPIRMVVSIVGAIPRGKRQEEKVKSLVEKYFGKFRSQGVNPKTFQFTFVQTKPRLKLHYKKTEQAHFCLGVRAFKRVHPDRYALSVLATILGGNMSSRLFTEIREKRGLAYYVRTSTERFYETGNLVTQAGTDINKAQEAIKVILEEYQKVANGKWQMANSELKKAKEYLRGRLVLELEDSHFVASLYAESELLENKVRTPREIIEGIEKVTVEDVARVAQKIFLSKNLNLAIIGPYKDKEDFAKILTYNI